VRAHNSGALRYTELSMSTLPPTLEKIDHIHIHVSDRTASEAWYREVLGLHRLPELAFWASGGGPLTLGNASGTVHLALFESPREKCRSVVAFAVGAADFLAWREQLQRVLGAAPELVDHTIAWSMYFRDPDGNPYEVTCYEHEAVAGLIGNRGRG
jgi:catechol 2,3-dioxygenase-like lactoylglutathione lyase family enzyme